jgi:hypothetical protein
MIFRRALAVSACILQLTGRCIWLPVLREEGRGALMGCGRALVSGGCVLKGGNEMGHEYERTPERRSQQRAAVSPALFDSAST